MNLGSMNIDEEKLEELIIDAKDAAIFTGLVYFTSKHQDDPKFDSASFMGFTLLPSPFPKAEFDIAVDLQKHWNYLLHRCSNDRQFIYESLRSVIESNSFIEKLWNICEAVHTEGIVQPITLNIMRVDYFLDANKLKMGNSTQTSLSNIEINTLGCGACAVPSKIVDLHRYMLHKTNNDEFITKLAPNNLHKNIVNGLIQAWRLYKNPNAHLLLVVRDLNFNFGDHRLLEYLIFELEPSIRFIRMTLTQIYKTARLQGNDKRLFIGDDEIALVYFKAGFNPDNYPTENEWTARLLIEKSKAIKAPKIEYQLMCAKKFQQYLSEPNTIEKFIQDEKTANLLRETFVKQYSFDQNQEKNSKLFKICLNQYEKFVLKPQLEGGGNNIWGENIKKTIESIKNTQELYSYILMERIEPVKHFNYLITAGAKTSNVSVDSEIGIYGISIGDDSNEMIKNECGGYALFTKEAKSNEWGETLGSGTFDSIWFSS